MENFLATNRETKETINFKAPSLIDALGWLKQQNPDTINNWKIDYCTNEFLLTEPSDQFGIVQSPIDQDKFKFIFQHKGYKFYQSNFLFYIDQEKGKVKSTKPANSVCYIEKDKIITLGGPINDFAHVMGLIEGTDQAYFDKKFNERTNLSYNLERIKSETKAVAPVKPTIKPNVIKRKAEPQMDKIQERMEKAKDALINGGWIFKTLLDDLKTLGHGSKLERVFAWLRQVHSIEIKSNYEIERFKMKPGARVKKETIEKSVQIIKEILDSMSSQRYVA